MFTRPTHSGVRRGFCTQRDLPVVTLAIVALATVACSAEPRDESPGSEGDPPVLRLEKYGASEQAFHVVSTLIVGPTESILFDGQYKVSDGRRLADRIAATGTSLRAIVLSHADHDHYMGAGEIVERFPGTPVYVTQATLDDFVIRSVRDLEAEHGQGQNPEAPDRLIVPQLLPGGTLTVDGEEIVVIRDLVGDVRAPASTALWIPSLRAVLTGDLVFDGVHPWLGDSDRESRVRWRSSLGRLAALDPAIVVPGHKRDLSSPDSAESIDGMVQYLLDYDAFMESASTPDELIAEMLAAYPDLALPILMQYGAQTWFDK